MNIAQINFNQIDQNAFSDPNASAGGQLERFTPGATSLSTIINAAIPWIFTIAGMLLLVYLIFGGLQLMLSRGDPKAAGAAKAHIGNALVGFIIIFIAFWIVQLLGIILGIKGIGNVFTSG